ncbi:hypothetical protein [Flavobacterium sp. H4147]|uniref:hypothetical protein n=1 Tax=Flavobacterium sp. H4147 TaxID=3034149 RepID=UPI0023EAC626|nr:hypothetical protein [Flavobacterium sp. H4147]
MKYLYEHIDTVKIRPSLYVGSSRISDLYIYLNGYQTALRDLKFTEKTLLPLPFWFFHEYVAQKFDYYESTSGWCNMILDQVEHDEQKGFNLFYLLFDEFKKLKIDKSFLAYIGDSQRKFHFSDKAPKKLIGYDLNAREPLFKDPLKVYYVRLSNLKKYNGYIAIVQNSDEYILERKIFRDEKDVLNYFKSYFGNDTFNWETYNVENINFDELN